MSGLIRTIGALCVLVACGMNGSAETVDMSKTHRLYQGVTFYIDNADGKAFDVQLDLRDLNLYGNGPREVLFKVYDPDGQPLVREYIPDDGVESEAYLPAIGGWDHELQYYALCRAHGTKPMISWSAFSDAKRLATQAKRTFTRHIQGGKKGIYRVLLVGDRDHYATLNLSPDLPRGVCGHAMLIHGHTDLFKERYFYVPRGSTGMHVVLGQPDAPAERAFTISTEDGSVLFTGRADGGFTQSNLKFNDGEYDDQVLKLTVSEGKTDYIARFQFKRNEKAYCGVGSPAVLCESVATAKATRGGAIYVADEVFWHPWQVRFEDWMNNNTADAPVQAQLDVIRPYFRNIGPSDGRDSAVFCNWAYAMGYYGFKVWRPAWLLSKNDKTPKDVKAIIDEALIMTGDRTSFALDWERVNGNAFAQIPVRLWYGKTATGDRMLTERYNVWFDRWLAEGWGTGAGMSKSGTSQEHFAHDANYGTYILNNWLGKAGGGGQWVEHGILDDTDDPRFQQAFDKVLNWLSYVIEAEPRVHTYAFNSRIHGGPVHLTKWLKDKGIGKHQPGPDLTVSVNDGDEFFAARRKHYYVVSHHGRITPEWLSETFYGQIGFGGGVLLQVTVPGKGSVINSSPAGSYGKDLYVSNWRNFHIHGIAGVTWNGLPFHAGIGEHHDAKLDGNVLTSSGDIRNRNMMSKRRYEYQPDGIQCHVSLADAGHKAIRALWISDRPYGDVREAYELIPFVPKAKPSLLDANGAALGEPGESPVQAKTIVLAREGFGLRIELDQPRNVTLGGNNSVLIEIVNAKDNKPQPASAASLDYRIVPYVD